MIVAAAILDSLAAPKRLLCAQRSYPPQLAGLWEFPGGKVEPGESPEAAIAREICEELRCGIRLGQRIGAQRIGGEWPLATPGLRMRLWLAEVCAGEPLLGASHRELRWVGLPAIRALPWIPADRAIVDAVLEATQKQNSATEAA